MQALATLGPHGYIWPGTHQAESRTREEQDSPAVGRTCALPGDARQTFVPDAASGGRGARIDSARALIPWVGVERKRQESPLLRGRRPFQG